MYHLCWLSHHAFFGSNHHYHHKSIWWILRVEVLSKRNQINMVWYILGCMLPQAWSLKWMQRVMTFIVYQGRTLHCRNYSERLEMFLAECQIYPKAMFISLSNWLLCCCAYDGCNYSAPLTLAKSASWLEGHPHFNRLCLVLVVLQLCGMWSYFWYGLASSCQHPI